MRPAPAATKLVMRARKSFAKPLLIAGLRPQLVKTVSAGAPRTIAERAPSDDC
jgi:hypothetical protein